MIGKWFLRAMLGSAAVMLLSPAICSANILTESASGSVVNPADGKTLSASVAFSHDTSTNQLVVTLTNTAADFASVPTDVLTAVFFSTSSSLSLTPVGISAPAIINAASDTSHQLGDEWGYFPQSGVPPGVTQNNSLTSSGFGGSGMGNFPAADNNPDNLDGPPWGIITGVAGNANHAITDHPYAQTSVTFTLSGYTGDLSDISLTDLRFQWGTALDEPHTTPREPTPEPSTILAALTAVGPLMGLAWLRRRKGTRAGV